MPPKNPKKKDHASAYEKKVRKKGKTMVAGGSVGMGHHEPSSDSGDPELDINRAIQMKAQPLKFQTTAPSSRHLGLTKPKAKKHPHALTTAVAASAAATAAAEEDTTGSQPHSQDQDPAKQPDQKRPKKKGPSESPPPYPSVSPTHTEPPVSNSDEDEESAEDATGRRKKASITQMLNENQEEDLADWWRDHPGLYDKSNETYRRKAKKDG